MFLIQYKQYQDNAEQIQSNLITSNASNQNYDVHTPLKFGQ